MSYIGAKPTIGNFQICDAISVVNGQAAYTMQVGSVNVIPQSSNHMIVSLNGVIQKPGGANPSFTVSGATITFASNLATGDVINFIQILGDVLDLGVPSDGVVTSVKLASNSVTTAKITDANVTTSKIADANITGAKTNFVSTSSAAGLQIKGDGTTDGTLQLNCSQNSHGIKLKSPAHSASASYTLTFPTTDGNANQFLQSNGSGVLTWADAGGGGFTLLQTTNISSAVGYVTIGSSSLFSSTYDQYIIRGNMRPSSNSANGYVRVRTSGGAQTSNYKFSGMWQYSGSATVNTNHSSGASQFNNVLGQSVNDNSGATFEIFLSKPNTTDNYKPISFRTVNMDSSPDFAHHLSGGAWVGATTALTGLDLYFSTGNIDTGGVITLHGVNKS